PRRKVLRGVRQSACIHGRTASGWCGGDYGRLLAGRREQHWWPRRRVNRTPLTAACGNVLERGVGFVGVVSADGVESAAVRAGRVDAGVVVTARCWRRDAARRPGCLSSWSA